MTAAAGQWGLLPESALASTALVAADILWEVVEEDDMHMEGVGIACLPESSYPIRTVEVRFQDKCRVLGLIRQT